MLLQADARRIPLADGTVQCIVTSPPYWGLRDYGLNGAGIGLEPTLGEYIANMRAVGRELWQALRDDGVFWLNFGDAYAGSGGAHTNEKAPGISKSFVRLGASRAVDGRNKRNCDGTGALDRLKPKDLIGLPWRVAFALQGDGWYLRSDCIWHKPNPMPESVRDRPTRAHEYVFLLTKSARYYYDAQAIAEDAKPEHFGRYAYPVNIGAKETAGAGRPNRASNTPGMKRVIERRNRRTVWTIPTQSYGGAHFATFPEKLVEPCILVGSHPGDIVLDPFCGSGTVGVVAQKHGRQFVGVDMSAPYLELARERIARAPVGMGL